MNTHPQPSSNTDSITPDNDHREGHKSNSIARKRPVAVWLISTIFVVVTLVINGYFALHLFGYGSNATYAAGLSVLTVEDYVRRIVAGLLSLAAGISLFMLRKITVVLFLTMLGLDGAFLLYRIFVGTAVPSMLLVLLIPGAISWYALRLSKRGLLV